MTILSVQGLSIVYSEFLFKDLSFNIAEGDRMGVVAGNGAGKTTLLKSLVGSAEATSGHVQRSRFAKIALVNQMVPDDLLDVPMSEAVLSLLPPDQREVSSWRSELLLDHFDTPSDLRFRLLRELSGGWQRLALIGRAWILDPDVLLLDEPTNHLDLSKILVLERWLNTEARDAAIMAVSHDRRFLDRCTNQTLFLRKGSSKIYAHPFSRAKQLLANDNSAEDSKRDKELKEIERLRQSAHQLRLIGKNNRSDAALRKSNLISQRARNLEEALSEVQAERRGEIRLSNRGIQSNRLLSLERVAILSPGHRPIFHIGRFQLSQQDRVVIMGRNGSGKSSFLEFLRTAVSTRQNIAGVSVSPSVVFSYLDQQLSQLPGHKTVQDFIGESFSLGNQRTNSSLAAAGFTFEQQSKAISTLSPGQKSRLALLALRMTEPNLYLMDEPTNHLDIEGQEQLEMELSSRGAAAILSSHDRAFCENVGTRYLLIENGRLYEIESPEPFYRSLIENVAVSRLVGKLVAC